MLRRVGRYLADLATATHLFLLEGTRSNLPFIVAILAAGATFLSRPEVGVDGELRLRRYVAQGVGYSGLAAMVVMTGAVLLGRRYAAERSGPRVSLIGQTVSTHLDFLALLCGRSATGVLTAVLTGAMCTLLCLSFELKSGVKMSIDSGVAMSAEAGAPTVGPIFIGKNRPSVRFRSDVDLPRGFGKSIRIEVFAAPLQNGERLMSNFPLKVIATSPTEKWRCAQTFPVSALKLNSLLLESPFEIPNGPLDLAFESVDPQLTVRMAQDAVMVRGPAASPLFSMMRAATLSGVYWAILGVLALWIGSFLSRPSAVLCGCFLFVLTLRDAFFFEFLSEHLGAGFGRACGAMLDIFLPRFADFDAERLMRRGFDCSWRSLSDGALRLFSTIVIAAISRYPRISR